MKKRIFMTTIVVIMLTLVLTMSAFAADVAVNLSDGPYTIETAGTYVVSAYTGTNTLTIKADAVVTLQGVNITAGIDASAVSIESGNVTLNVSADNTLIGGDNGAGIYVAEGASVTITGSGTLTAIGNAGVDDASGAAGIGGTWANGSSGAITIDGATVNAYGYGKHGSGIGSGSGKVTGEIKIINGANVTAYGGYYANGEGTKLQSDYGKTDPEGGAAIGGGAKTVSTIANITIADSTVKAYGGSKAAGIGANFWSSCGTITITGNSDVTAQGGSSSAGIGTSRAGDYGVTANIVILGGKVTATGGDYGAGIGGGYNNDSLGNGAASSALPQINIAISGGTIVANGGEGGAGIGGGYRTDNVAIDISGGSVTAKAGALVSGKTVEDGGSASAIGNGANGSGAFENSPAVLISNASVDVTSYYGGKSAIHGYVNDALSGDILLTEIGKPVVVVSLEDASGNITYHYSMQDALTAANAVVGGATIVLHDDITLGEKLTINGDVTILGEYTLTRANDYTGTLFAVSEGATLTLDGGLTIDGGNEYVFDSELYATDLANWETSVPSAESAKWFTPEADAPVASAYMITVKGADSTVNLNDVSITNHYSTNGSGIVSANTGATVTLTGANITHCANVNGSGLVVNASGGVWSRENELITVVMNEGTVIDGNHVGGNHGIFKIYMGTYFTMNGGEVKNTTGWNSNGTVVGIYHAVFTMNGGTICSNSSVYGPNNGRNAAIYGHSNHLFTMNDGTICHNTGRAKAGVDSPYSEEGYTGSTTINGGTIVNNEVVGPWVEPDVSGGTTLAITGGTFTQDVTKYCAEHYCVVPNGDGIWTVIPDGAFFVTFVYGTSNQETVTVKAGSLVARPADPVRYGAVFGGWYLDSACTIPFDFNKPIINHVTIYAKWEINPIVFASYPIHTTYTKNGNVQIASYANAGDTVDVLVVPNKGYKLSYLEVTNGNGLQYRVSGGNNVYTFTMPANAVYVTAHFKDNLPVCTYSDVIGTTYYYDAVRWGLGKSVLLNTTGKFNPDNVCTRAQTVELLWRAAGCPAPKGTVAFTDVPKDASYAQAVQWAFEQGITTGTTATTFSPNETVTRAQVMTFLWRYAGSPYMIGNSFSDVPADAYYASAVNWAVQNGITTGTTYTTFSPNEGCTNAHIITFLYRWFGK